MIIRDHLDVAVQPTVVRLDDLRAPDSAWITESFLVTEEAERHFESVRALLSRETGSGVFLIGHYGAGKSHFLAFLSRMLEAGRMGSPSPAVVPVSLVNFRAADDLETIVAESLAEAPRERDRRETWARIAGRFPAGLVLIIDELSEFLRAKPAGPGFNEDLRFLQFLGEWAQDRRFWVVAALQEQIEHTGDIEYDLYRKIRDRYPVRLLLTPAHVRDLLAKRILQKKPSYAEAVEDLTRDLGTLYPAGAFDAAAMAALYPLHPATIDLLEEVRDRFSQARGIVDFALTRLRGDAARGVAPFLDQPWGSLVTPDQIVDHFSDLFEIQSEFLPIAQKVLPHYRAQMAELFEKESLRELAWKLLKLLILVHLSPRRQALEADEAANWLLLRASRTQPARNREVIRKTLESLATQGAFVRRKGTAYSLELEDEGRLQLEARITREAESLKGRGPSVFELVVSCLERAAFNPFELPRDRWHTRKVRWCFHDRDLRVFVGGGTPPETPSGPAVQIGLPWGPPPEAPGCYALLPRSLEVTPEVLDLAALVLVKDRPLAPDLLDHVGRRLSAAAERFAALVRSSFAEATLVDPAGAIVPQQPPRLTSLDAWLTQYGEVILRRTYPLFEKYSPVHGPLPREAYLQLMRFASDHDLGAPEAPDLVKLVREAYLVPLGLLHRRGTEYRVEPKLDGHELVRHLAPVLQHHPTPERVYGHLAAPVYGLVPDQIHLLLLVLLIQGEIDILLGSSSYRENFEAASNPLQYDRIVPGHGLNTSQLRDLETLCTSFRLGVPRQWSVMAQKRAIEQLRNYGRRQRDQLGSFLSTLREQEDVGGLPADIEKHIQEWLALEKGENELQAFQHFLFEIGTPARFSARAAELSSLPARLERLIRESRRLRHVLGFPEVKECGDLAASQSVAAIPAPPPLTQPEALEEWIRAADGAYHLYRGWYRREHERWREGVARRDLWTYRPPPVARSRHAGASAIADELDARVARARSLQCAGLGPLDFQPRCRCGFDGAAGPVDVVLNEAEDLRRRLEEELRLFFGQEKVRARVKSWLDSGIELNDSLLAFVEGRAPYPLPTRLDLFDQHLAGLELVKSVPAAELLVELEGRTWDRGSLAGALDRVFERFGPRITIRKAEAAPRQEIVAWCCELALSLGRPLPDSFSDDERALVPKVIRPEWITREAMARLSGLGLGEAGLDRALSLLLDGALPDPGPACPDSAVRAALDLLSALPATTPGELAERATLLYRQDRRFRRIRPGPWREHLDRLADSSMQCPSLPQVLTSLRPAEWLVIDAMGLPILDTVLGTLRAELPAWTPKQVAFGRAAVPSNTDMFFRELTRGGMARSLTKIDTVDALLHDRRLDFAELERLARAELEIALKRVARSLDPAKRLIVFGDHGFRLAPDGATFRHGGSSALERLVPVIELEPAR